MPSLAPLKREFQSNTIQGDPGLLAWFKRILASTVGGKYLVALTGIGLTGFVVIHMIGNLQVFAGQDAVNRYAKMLKDFGPLLWVARIGLLTIFLLHVVWAVRLSLRAKAARPIPYVHKDAVQATLASRTMLYTGLVVLAFLIYHLAHFTFGFVGGAEIDGKTVNYLDLRDAQGRHDVFNMIIFGFRNPVVSILYLVAQALLLLHLGHGIQSTFQTLGLSGPRWGSALRSLGWTLAFVVVAGNFAIVLAVWTGQIQPVAPIYIVGS